MGFFQRLFKARPPVPDSAKRYLGEDERELAWAQAVSGQVLVATQVGLHVVGERAHRVVPWHEISKAGWADRKLTVTEAKRLAGNEIVDEQPWQLEFDEPGGIPVILRQRVESSVVVSEHQSIGVGVRLIGRKVSGQDGLLWQYRFDRPDAASPGDHAQAEVALAALKDERTPKDL